MELLTLLADGQLHSGEELGERLGVSRAAISKQLGLWREQGLELEVVHGKGYRLMQPLQLLDGLRIRQGLSPTAQSVLAELLLESQVGSTNDVILQRLRQAPLSGLVCLAEQQTAGRGRRGRVWASPFACNFYGSFSWVFNGGFQSLEGLSLAVGVAVANALRELGVPEIGLKWPNDLMVGEAKLGGILLEMQGEAAGACAVVIGIGVNLWLSPRVRAALDRPVTDLATLAGRELDRQRVSACIIDHVLRLLRDYEAEGFSAWQQAWMARDVSRGKSVNILGLAEPVQGVASGVDQHGALLLQTTAGLQRIHAGEVSLREGEA